MKYLLSFFLLASMVLFGFGCSKQDSVSTPLQPGWKTYQNATYGFALDYGPKMAMTDRAVEIQATTYLGLPVTFFTALTDSGQGTGSETESVAFFYAMKDLTKEAFVQALIGSDPENVKVLETTETNQGGLAFTKIVSSTANGEKKNHYLYFKDATTVIISQFLLQDDVFNSVFKTLRKNM